MVVLTFGYDAYGADWQNVVLPKLIADHACNLLKTLSSYRETDCAVGWPTLQVSQCADTCRMNDRSYLSAIA